MCVIRRSHHFVCAIIRRSYCVCVIRWSLFCVLYGLVILYLLL